MWLTEDEIENLLYKIRRKPVKSREVNPEEKYRRDRAIIYLLTYAGHSNIATTSRYLKDSYSDLADAVNAMPNF